MTRLAAAPELWAAPCLPQRPLSGERETLLSRGPPRQPSQAYGAICCTQTRSDHTAPARKLSTPGAPCHGGPARGIACASTGCATGPASVTPRFVGHIHFRWHVLDHQKERILYWYWHHTNSHRESTALPIITFFTATKSPVSATVRLGCGQPEHLGASALQRYCPLHITSFTCPPCRPRFFRSTAGQPSPPPCN